MRILSAYDLPVDLDTGIMLKDINKHHFEYQEPARPRGIFSMCCLPQMNRRAHQKDFRKFEELIIHIHGGGFVSMSSNSHQNYTRIWANDTKIPIVSIDYRLSPQYQFPAALNDCWQVYHWLVENAESHLGITPKKIVVVGDSAGGNLAAALTVMAIKRNYRIPDGVILAYPGKLLLITPFSFEFE